MIVGVPKETFPGERRVALTPSVVDLLERAGLKLVLERGAGEEAGFPDGAYQTRGVRLADRDQLYRSADVIARVHAYSPRLDAAAQDLDRLRRDQVLVGFFDALWAGRQLEEVAARGVLAFALDLMLRISRTQAMDALS
ncbi:MAG: hypothetical protein ACP5U2_01990 [Bryobacteraceae bacterium]